VVGVELAEAQLLSNLVHIRQLVPLMDTWLVAQSMEGKRTVWRVQEERSSTVARASPGTRLAVMMVTSIALHCMESRDLT